MHSGLKTYTKESRIMAITGVDPEALAEKVSTSYRLLLAAERDLKKAKRITELTLNVLIEKRRSELETTTNTFTETALKTYAHAHDEYRAAVFAEDESEGRRTELEADHKQYKIQLDLLYKEAKLAHDELFTLRQKR